MRSFDVGKAQPIVEQSIELLVMISPPKVSSLPAIAGLGLYDKRTVYYESPNFYSNGNLAG